MRAERDFETILKRGEVVCQLEEMMVPAKTNKDPKDTNGKPQDRRYPPKARFGVFGQEMIEKEVKPAGNSGRIYLPLDWVGKHVKIIRID